jgi:hypothetical protein
MLGRNGGIKRAVAVSGGSMKHAFADAANAIAHYVDPLSTDEKLRRRLAAAIVAGSAAQRRARSQTGLTGLARRVASDPVLRAQLVEMATQLQAAQRRAKRARSHKLRNTIFCLGGFGVAVAAVPAAREAVSSVLRSRHAQRVESSTPNPPPVAEAGATTEGSRTT